MSRLVAALLIACAPSRPAAAQPATSEAIATATAADTSAGETVRLARSASAGGRWTEAAELWRTALAGDDRVAEHWDAYGESLFRARRYREAAAAHQRAIQLDASRAGKSSWKVARAYARLGNEKQASRWTARAAALGFGTVVPNVRPTGYCPGIDPRVEALTCRTDPACCLPPSPPLWWRAGARAPRRL